MDAHALTLCLILSLMFITLSPPQWLLSWKSVLHVPQQADFGCLNLQCASHGMFWKGPHDATERAERKWLKPIQLRQQDTPVAGSAPGARRERTWRKTPEEREIKQPDLSDRL